MSRRSRNDLARWVDDHLEAYVDGELSPEEERRVEAFVAEDAETARQLRLAERVRRALAAADRPACPPEVARAVLAQARLEGGARSPGRRRARTPAPAHDRGVSHRVPAPRRSPVRRKGSLWTSILRPSAAVAAFVLVVVASALVGREPQPPAGPDLSATPEEVQQSLREIKWTLAFVSDVGRRTGQSIRREVIEERVADPVQQALLDALGSEPSS